MLMSRTQQPGSQSVQDFITVEEAIRLSGYTAQYLRRMARQGKLQYFPDFPRPYCRIDLSRTYVVQGVFGNTSMRVTFSPLAEADAEEQLRILIETPLPDERDE